MNENTQNVAATNLDSLSWLSMDWSHQPWMARAEITVEAYARDLDLPGIESFARSVLFDIFRLNA